MICLPVLQCEHTYTHVHICMFLQGCVTCVMHLKHRPHSGWDFPPHSYHRPLNLHLMASSPKATSPKATAPFLRMVHSPDGAPLSELPAKKAETPKRSMKYHCQFTFTHHNP